MVPIRLSNKLDMRKKLYSEEDALPALLKGQEEGLDFFFLFYYARLLSLYLN